MFQKFSCLPDVFDSVLAYAKPAHAPVSEALLPAFRTFSLSSLTLPQTVRVFNISLHSQTPQQQYTMLSFSSMRRHGHSHKLTSSRALRYYTLGIPFWTSRKRQPQKSKYNWKTTTCFNLRDHTFSYHYVRVTRGIRKHCTWRKWLTYHSRSKFITLPTFELSSFRENGFFVLLLFPRCSRWYLSLDA